MRNDTICIKITLAGSDGLLGAINREAIILQTIPISKWK